MNKARLTVLAHQRQLGFTMIELMITVTLVAVLASIAVPSMRTYALNNRLSGTAQELLRTIQTTRSDAVKLQQNVVMCFSGNPQASQPTCATSGIIGWITFQDTDKDWSRATDGTEAIIETHAFDSTKMKVLFNYSGKVSFAGTGWYPLDKTSTPTGAKTPVTSVVICDSRGNVDSGGGTGTLSVARGIIISNDTGRAQITNLRSSTSPKGIALLLTDTGSSC